MRWFGSAVAGVIALCFGVVSSAQADGHVRNNWTGFYAGGHLGGAWTDVEFDDFLNLNPPDVPVPTPFGSQPTGSETDASGLFGGGQVGYNQQFGNFVAGVELSYSGADLSDGFRPGNAPPQTLEYASDINSIFQAVVRLGYAMDKALIYGKIGYANVKVETSGNRIPGAVGTPIALSGEERHDGLVLGGGVEYMISPNIVVGLDYSYINLQSKHHRMDIFLLDGTPTDSAIFADIDPDIHAITARISYKFGGTRSTSYK